MDLNANQYLERIGDLEGLISQRTGITIVPWVWESPDKELSPTLKWGQMGTVSFCQESN